MYDCMILLIEEPYKKADVFQLDKSSKKKKKRKESFIRRGAVLHLEDKNVMILKLCILKRISCSLINVLMHRAFPFYLFIYFLRGKF